MKARYLVLLAVAVVVLIGGATLAWYFWPLPKHDFDQLGGTVLVYEIAPAEEGDDRVRPENVAVLMAERLQGRLDSEGRHEVTVRAVGKDRVEIRVARTPADHAAKIALVKSLIAKVGLLEFRVLANSHDDKQAIDQVRRMLNTAADPLLADPLMAKELEDLQLRGLPPPGPRVPGEKKPQVFVINLAGKTKSSVTCSWVELGPHECRALNLDNAAENDATRNAAWLAAKKRRGQATTLKYADGPADINFPERVLLQGALFFSRECKDRNLPEEERQKKAVEYFVLARDPEFEPAFPETRTPPITGVYLVSASSTTSRDDRPAVAFAFNSSGGELFGTLTRKNISETGGPNADTHIRRHLAIIFDGLVLSAPTINSEIRTRGMISGNFTQEEVDDMVNILRGGALPARLKSLPVSETEVRPKEKK